MMASIDTIDGEDTINVTDVVGAVRAVNLIDDVIVVQALLAFIYSFPAFKQSVIPIPVPTGTLDKNTARLILDYQQRSNRLNARNGSPFRLLEDGRVSHARGKTEWGRNMLWTIIQMNFHASLFAAASRAPSLIPELVKRFPQLKDILKR